MTVDELMLALHRDYLETIAMGRQLGWSMAHLLPPLSYRRFCFAITLVITGDEHDEQGVLERYLIFEQLAKRQGRVLRPAQFIAACVVGNTMFPQAIRDTMAELMGAPKVPPLVMN